jgi:hypothetical protein
MRFGPTSLRLAIAFTILLSVPAFAASPTGGSVTATTGSTAAWDGFPGPAYSNDNLSPLSASTADANCTDGTNCDTFTLTLAPGDYTGKRARVSITWTIPADDYDVYVHAGSNSGAVVTKSAGSPPSTLEANTWDINGVVTQGVNDKFTVHVVYFTVGPLDAYHGTVSIENIPSVVVRTPKFVWGSKTRMKFSRTRPLYGNGTATGSEPSIRTDYQGNVYVGSIRGVPGGNDLWRLDLNPNSPTFDPFLRAGSAFIDANGNVTNPTYKGQPDATSPDPNRLTTAGDGGGDMDIAVGFGPSLSNPNGPPTLATTSLAAADISSQRSFDRGDSFMRNPDANITVPVDDRNWMEFYGGDTVYLAYREFTGLVATSKFYINRSDDGGLTYGPAVLAALGGNTTGNIAVDQADGTVYFCYQGTSSNQVMVTVGHPISPAVAPAEYSTHVAATGKSTTIAALFPVVKVAKDGTVYVAYSDGGQGIFMAHSRDQGNTWSEPVRVSDPSSTTSLLPWMAAGDAPGAVDIAWIGNSAATSEDKQGLNNDAANWQVYFAQTFDATSTNPTFYEAIASDHIIHAANISLGGFGGTANRNLGDFFQIALDPQGMAVFAFSDDSNDFSGNPYVIHQTGGYSLHTGNRINLGDDKSSTAVDASAPQVVDGKHDAQIRTGAPTGLNDDSPVDVVSIRYSCESTPTSTILGATMKLSGLTFVPPQGAWRMHFTSNPSQPGISDRGDQWYLEADTDAQGNRTYVYGTATRTGSGGFTYTPLGNADVGRFDLTNSSVTVKVDLAKLNAVAKRGPIAGGSVLTGLRGSARAVYTVVNGGVTSAGAGVVDSTRGGTSYTVGNCTAATLVQ